MNPAELREACDALASRLTGWRRELHRHPELGFEERWTAGYVERRLRELGLEVRSGLARTGVAALLRAKRGVRPAVLLRADMDGLPIQEAPGREYGSEIRGRMHACGHDAHMAMLLGAATVLAPLADRLPRDVLFCFQPAEEGQGGAERMIQEGVLDLTEIGSVFALHVWSQFEAGTAHVRSGPMLAAQDEFRARVVGQGGHGAMPHTTIDPIVAAAQGVLALQSIVSRNVDPTQPAVVTVGSIHGGSAPNVIPEDVQLEGTLRSFTDEVRGLLRQRVEEQLVGSAESARCRLEFELRPGFPAVVNDETAVQVVRKLARSVFGEARVHEPAPLAASEDFAFFLRERPGAFVLIGAGNRAAGIEAPHHSSLFDLDETVLPRGAELFVRLALEPEGLA
jgi:amidohydrolase